MSCSRSRVSAGTFVLSVMMAWLSADPHLQVRSFGSTRYRLAHHVACILGILQQHADDLLDRHVIVLRMPAVVIGHHRDRHIAELSFARQSRFGEVGHADDVHAPTAI